jgi:hypothetical protein
MSSTVFYEDNKYLHILYSADDINYVAAASGKEIEITYNKTASELISDTDEPNFDKKHHLALAYFALFNLTNNPTYKLLYDQEVRTANKPTYGTVKPRAY